MAFSLKLNGTSHEVDAAPGTPLLWVIRDELKLPGTKFGCGQALCGACTVHLNGQAVRSCVRPVGSVRGEAILTIEGLADGDFFDLYYYAPRIFMTALGCATPLIAWLAGPRVGRWIVPVAFTDSCPRCQHPVMLDSERCTECGLRVTS